MYACTYLYIYAAWNVLLMMKQIMKSMKKILLTLLLAPLCVLTVLAQDPIAEPDSVFAQTLDSAVIEDPEWYVAPISLDSLLARQLAPRRAAADACPHAQEGHHCCPGCCHHHG